LPSLLRQCGPGENLHELTLYARLEPAYGQRLWVIADGDTEGSKATDQLTRRFAGWPVCRFSTWDVLNFEEYHPRAVYSTSCPSVVQAS
jgi:hypothetical protein